MNYVFSALLLFMSSVAWSCTCGEIAPIEEALAGLPILVEGRVVSLEQTDDKEFGKLTHRATLRVTKVLKGSVSSDEITVVHFMCYASVYPGNMEMHHTYVLPLTMPAPEVPVEEGSATAVVGAKPGQYGMAGCAHSGLERVDGELYKLDYDIGLQRRKEPYMSYTAFRIWWPVAQAALVSFAFMWDLHSKLGLSFLAFSLILGTAGAYFAARYRPWLLIPVLLLVITLCALNFGDVLERRIFISQYGTLYWTFSWIVPAIIVGGGALGYLTRSRARGFVPAVEVKNLPES